MRAGDSPPLQLAEAESLDETGQSAAAEAMLHRQLPIRGQRNHAAR